MNDIGLIVVCAVFALVWLIGSWLVNRAYDKKRGDDA